MNQLPQPQPFPVLAIISEAARLHWRHILIVFAAAALYAPPLMTIFTPVAAEIAKLPPDAAPEQVAPMMGKMALGGVMFLFLSASLFAFWVRVTLMGPRAALSDDALGWPFRIVRTAGLFVLAGLGTIAGLLPISLLVSVFGIGTGFAQILLILSVTFVMSFFFALLSRWLVETALDIPRDKDRARPRIAMDAHLRLAALFTSVTFGLMMIEIVIGQILAGIDAPLSAQIVTAIYLAVSVTAFASIHAIVYRLRTVPQQG